jgi:hypothetical protein
MCGRNAAICFSEKNRQDKQDEQDSEMEEEELTGKVIVCRPWLERGAFDIQGLRHIKTSHSKVPYSYQKTCCAQGAFEVPHFCPAAVESALSFYSPKSDAD